MIMQSCSRFEIYMYISHETYFPMKLVEVVILRFMLLVCTILASCCFKIVVNSHVVSSEST